MNRSEYIQSRNSLINDFETKFSFDDNEALNGQFNMVSASLSNFVPGIHFSSHKDIYKKILVHKKLSIVEQSSYQILDFIEAENFSDEIIGLLKTKPTIICTFHTGSYRVINLLLAKYKIPFTLVIGKDITEKEGELFSSLFSNLPGNVDGNDFGIINAENAKAGVQMLRKLKQGRTLVLYIDGNSGAGTTTTENENNCIVNFLHQQIFARKGISFLAHVANVPILTVASYRKSWDEIRLQFFDPIYPDKNIDRNKFARDTTQRIYDLVAPIIRSYPEQWEGWLYIHKVANILNSEIQPPSSNHSPLPTEKIGFNSQLFGIFKLHNIPFLLKKNTYLFYEVDGKLYDLLTGCLEHPVRRECFENNVFHQLYEQGVLVYL